VGYQLEFCEAMWSDFKIKKVKRRFGANNTNTSTASTSASAGISANNSSTDLVAEGETAEAPVEQDNVSRKSIGKRLMCRNAILACALCLSGLDLMSCVPRL